MTIVIGQMRSLCLPEHDEIANALAQVNEQLGVFGNQGGVAFCNVEKHNDVIDLTRSYKEQAAQAGFFRSAIMFCNGQLTSINQISDVEKLRQCEDTNTDTKVDPQ